MKVKIEFDFWSPHCYPAVASIDLETHQAQDLPTFHAALLPLVEEVFHKAKAEYDGVSRAISSCMGVE